VRAIVLLAHVHSRLVNGTTNCAVLSPRADPTGAAADPIRTTLMSGSASSTRTGHPRVADACSPTRATRTGKKLVGVQGTFEPNLVHIDGERRQFLFRRQDLEVHFLTSVVPPRFGSVEDRGNCPAFDDAPVAYFLNQDQSAPAPAVGFYRTSASLTKIPDCPFAVDVHRFGSKVPCTPTSLFRSVASCREQSVGTRGIPVPVTTPARP